jgi:hypothetical protein
MLKSLLGAIQLQCVTTKKTLATNKASRNTVVKHVKSFLKPYRVYARKLGIRCLWIDSLCIIQDDRDDWYREAANMRQIYQNIMLTLAATDSTDGSHGLFRSPPPPPRGIELKGRGSAPPLYFARVASSRQLENSPLLQLAWVYQERLLLPRILHFSPGELIWECNEGIDC